MPASSPPEGPEFRPDRIRTVLCDLDGVVWLAHQPIPGSVQAIADLRAGGRRVVFVTNNSAARIADHESALAAIGIGATGDVVSSSQAAASLLVPGERVLVAGGPGVVEAVELVGGIAILNDGLTDPGSVDAVVVGLHRDFDYRRLAVASVALHGGARLIATNDDATYPTPTGLEPGGGSIVAAIATAGEVEPIVAGKPHLPMAALIARLLSADSFDPMTVVMVGDRPETDGRFATTIGCPFVLVRSGVLPSDAPPPSDVPVALDLADLGALAALFDEPPMQVPIA